METFERSAQEEPPITDPIHPIGLRPVGGTTLEVGWGGPDQVIAIDITTLSSIEAIERFMTSLERRSDLPAMSAAKLGFLAGVLARRLQNS